MRLYEAAPSLDMQIFAADIIVVATLVSATADVQSDGDLFLPVQSLSFLSSQYLKGTGPTEFAVEVRIAEFGATSRAEALELAQFSIDLRNTEYDSRTGILFLEGPLAGAGASTSGSTTSRSPANSASSTTTTYSFVPRNLRTASWEYSIDTIDKVWAPANNTASSPGGSSSGDRSASNTNPEYIIDGKTDPPETITLTALESRISEITAEINQGADIAGYEDCIGKKYRRENVYQDRVPLDRPLTISSGGDPATQVLVGWEVQYGDSVYRNFYEDGRDAAYFGTTIIDDDDDPGRYNFTYGPNRPLPAGLYEVEFSYQLPHQIPCDYRPEAIYKDKVTVTAPAGALHEAFFDPVTVGTAVKADSTNGVLKPTSFTVGGTATELTSLKWSNNKVALTLNPHVSLGSAVLSFIELDGSVSLSLSSSDATVDSAAGTYSWPVTTQPWEDGDQLMLRIRKPAGVYVALSPKADIFATRTDITVEWIDAATCADDYFVAVYNNEELHSVLLDLGRHSNQATSTGTKNLPVAWARLPTHAYFNAWVGVICTTTGWRVVGKASVESGMPNNPATGVPTISGTTQAGETLTASTSGIADADGLTNVSHSYQWLADDTDISEATNSTYVLTNDEVGKTIKVRVTFTDDARTTGKLSPARRRRRWRQGPTTRCHGSANHQRHSPGGRNSHGQHLSHRG